MRVPHRPTLRVRLRRPSIAVCALTLLATAACAAPARPMPPAQAARGAMVNSQVLPLNSSILTPRPGQALLDRLYRVAEHTGGRQPDDPALLRYVAVAPPHGALFSATAMQFRDGEVVVAVVPNADTPTDICPADEQALSRTAMAALQALDYIGRVQHAFAGREVRILLTGRGAAASLLEAPARMFDLQGWVFDPPQGLFDGTQQRGCDELLKKALAQRRSSPLSTPQPGPHDGSGSPQ